MSNEQHEKREEKDKDLARSDQPSQIDTLPNASVTETGSDYFDATERLMSECAEQLRVGGYVLPSGRLLRSPRLSELIDQGIGALRQWRRLREAATWQPIATAPKDGNAPLLVAWRDGSICHRVTAMYSPAPPLQGWWAWGTHQVFPTHWLPLPEPPQVGSEKV